MRSRGAWSAASAAAALDGDARPVLLATIDADFEPEAVRVATEAAAAAGSQRPKSSSIRPRLRTALAECRTFSATTAVLRTANTGTSPMSSGRTPSASLATSHCRQSRANAGRLRSMLTGSLSVAGVRCGRTTTLAEKEGATRFT